MDNSKKITPSLILGLAVLALLAGFFLYVGFKPERLKSSALPTSTPSQEAILVIKFTDGKERWFAGQTREDASVLEALVAASLAGNFSFKGDSQILALGGVANNGAKRWKCIVGNSKIENLAQQPLRPGDKVVCSYGDK